MSHGINKQSGECCSICLKFESSVPQIKVTRGTKRTLGYYATVVKDGTTQVAEASLQVSTVRFAETVYG